MIVDGWTSYDVAPPRSGLFWVNLDREPGAVHLFWYSPEHLWASPGTALGSVDQRERINLFGSVIWWRKAEIPTAPTFTPEYYERTGGPR